MSRLPHGGRNITSCLALVIFVYEFRSLGYVFGPKVYYRERYLL